MSIFAFYPRTLATGFPYLCSDLSGLLYHETDVTSKTTIPVFWKITCIHFPFTAYTRLNTRAGRRTSKANARKCSYKKGGKALKWLSFPKLPAEKNYSASYRVHVHQPEARELFSFHFKEFLQRDYFQERPLVILCIGTDRSTGDSLGPLIGSKLQASSSPLFKIYGTLEKPVHAVNLEETTNEIHRRFNRPYVVAVDACLGKAESIGYITIKSGPLQPGTGVNKSLPAVGNLHVVGVVNVGGFMEYLVLQNTRLNLVMQMAEMISDGLLQGCRNFFPSRPAMAESKTGLTPAFSE